MKEIQVRCHEPIAVDPTWEQGWSDVWLRWKWNPKRSCRAALTLIGRMELLSDMETSRACIKDYPNDSVFSDELKDQEDIYATIQKSFMLYSPKTASVYTNNDWITKDRAESMIALYLSTQGVFHPKFVWKRPKHIICPVTIVTGEVSNGDSVSPISNSDSACA